MAMELVKISVSYPVNLVRVQLWLGNLGASAFSLGILISHMLYVELSAI
jgi:hypothetical protein